jgi:hypothetical protein
MAKKKSIGKEVIRGLKQFSRKLKSSKPIRATRMRRMKAWVLFLNDEPKHIYVRRWPITRGLSQSGWKMRQVTIAWAEPVTLKAKR